MYLPEGMPLEDALKLFTAGDLLKLTKAITDLDDVALLLNKSWEKDIEMTYIDNAEREKAKYAFDSI
ncbi:hypothetical protein SCP_1400510 [Sparassis crispa]|uniref:Uncharacterized protein n=1 Tax=Sparassis crispa TaxID=139825 RepID=A0A401H2G6_9APHY|nr:hypothetical protein SCP_1400510 [Sparassis crispa]GBE88646.1 hypothetical protein SCP_1400510 [Sparassis crispa]